MSVDVHISQYKQIIATLREEISELKVFEFVYLSLLEREFQRYCFSYLERI